MRTLLLYLLLSVYESAAERVVGVQGQNVTLKCTYDVKTHGRLSACWSRGVLPYSRCGKSIVDTDGHSVIIESGRYRMLGRLQDGDVSLTILDVEKEDGGLYGCRVEIAGPFNDEKHIISLTVEDAPEPTSYETSTWSGAAFHTSPTYFSRDLQTSSSSINIITSKKLSFSQWMILLGVILGLILIVTATIIVYVVGKSQQTTKIHGCFNPFGHSVRFNSSSSSRHVYQQATAVSNIYQMEADEEYDVVR
ncbi:hepatitis A virus cellular receptor 2-like [Stigmatopora argus]